MSQPERTQDSTENDSNYILIQSNRENKIQNAIGMYVYYYKQKEKETYIELTLVIIATKLKKKAMQRHLFTKCK